ncbi:DUF6520 family protein [Flavobacterium sp. PLA-1-15]|uniref:DUF6520 family protein n=1 Tax=Flavobacterium sp. PLA-1-15 TaxID=3380533 RepID=UPI003B7ED2A0
MKNLFSKTVFPVALLLLAVGMAFNSNAMNKKRALLLETGWKHQTSAASCDNSPIQCSRIEGDDCVEGTYVIYRKTLAGACTIKMFKP